MCAHEEREVEAKISSRLGQEVCTLPRRARSVGPHIADKLVATSRWLSDKAPSLVGIHTIYLWDQGPWRRGRNRSLRKSDSEGAGPYSMEL